MRLFHFFVTVESAAAVIQGTFSNSDLVPFSAAVVYCLNVLDRRTCYSFCSGTLIAPDVVLTAGHCVNDADQSTFKKSTPPYPLTNVGVIVGSRNPRLGTDGVLVPVKSVFNAGYSRYSALFTVDDDLGLIFLSQCLSLAPGSIATAKVATLATEPASPNSVITIQGHGLNANIPDQVRTNDASLRYMKSALQTPSVCIDAAVEINLQLQGVDPSILDNPLNVALKSYFYAQFVPEKTICAGGNTWPYSACNGDSGGGWIDSTTLSGINQIVGVVSFQIDSSKSDTFCGYSPNYGTRVAFYADWIKEKILANSLNCAGWNISQTFASPNVESMPASDYSDVMAATRCTPFTQFQCYSGDCVDWDNVCDGTQDCGRWDNSDEDPAMCAGSGPVLHSQLPPFDGRAVANPNPFAKIDIPGDIPRIYPVDALPDTSRTRSVDPAIGLLTCSTLLDYMQLRMAAERAEGLNRAEYDTSDWTDLCTTFGECGLNDSSMGTFCDEWNDFMEKSAIAREISNGFNARFGSTASVPSFPHPPPPPALNLNFSESLPTNDTSSNDTVDVVGGPVIFDPSNNDTVLISADALNPNRIGISFVLLTTFAFL